MTTRNQTPHPIPSPWSRLRQRRAALIAVLGCCLSLGLAACGSSESSSTTKAQSPSHDYTVAQLSRFAVTSSQLPPGYSQTKTQGGTTGDLSKLATTRQQADLLNELTADGVEGFYVVAYRKDGSNGAANRPGSTAFAFGNPGEASRALPLLRNLISTGLVTTGSYSVTQSSVPVSGLGDQSVPGLRFAFSPPGAGPGAPEFSLYFYLWRDRNVDAFVAGGDALGDLSGPSILTIAKQVDFSATR
jgi:hypothetical protein